MYKHLFQHLVSEFEAAMFAKYPEATRAPKADQPRTQAMLYSLQSESKLHSFLLLQGNDHDQKFTVELGLARTRKFPWNSDCDYDEETCRCLPTFPVRVRLGHLMGKNHDHWWEATSTKDPPSNAGKDVLIKFLTQKINDLTFPPDRIGKSVKSVLKNFRQFGMPFLQECAQLK